MAETVAKVLDTPLDTLEGVGQMRAKELRARNLFTLRDLLEYFPRTYISESSECPIADLRADGIQTTRGEVTALDVSGQFRRVRLQATLSDGEERLALVWFNAPWMKGKIRPGQILRVQGQVKMWGNMPQMVQPKWEEIEPNAEPVGVDKLRPVYAAGAKMPSRFVEELVDRNLDASTAEIPEWFDADLLKTRRLMPRADAYRLIHRPAKFSDAMEARRRIVYDELMLMQLGLGISRRFRTGRLSAPTMKIDKLLDERIRKRFPFDLTAAQQRCVYEIIKDLQSGQPMNRLLQGDVGSGKTSVAVYAMLVAVANKMQAAILAPTEVLAEQHFLTLSNLLRDSAVTIDLFTSRTRRADKGALVKKLGDGKIHLAIGTQALIQEDVEFANLGLVVVDEQHKLGVKQRAVLKSKGYSPHYLVMTATPIPRTLALSFFADFDVSVIDALPPGRKVIKTRWLKQNQSAEAYRFVRDEVKRERQAYIVLPQIDDDGIDDVKSVLKHFDELNKGPLKGLRIAALHGQMKTAEKQAAMSAFRSGETDVLVATTVIEVGIDVPNATVMVIENADRFGLSQLHQLRGRVGRSSETSHCLMIADANSDDAEKRLTAMSRTGDGFEIAEMDLQLRGPGEFFGTRQHGLPEFKLADVTREIELLKVAKEDAMRILDVDPNLSEENHRGLREALVKQFGETLRLAQVG